jgi:hypothetical protein
MKPVGQFLLTIYAIVGGALAVPVFVSYIYASFYIVWQFGWGIFSGAGLLAILINAFMLALAPPFRAIFWLPSLILWHQSDQDNFWLWLAPGFFISGG